MSECDVNTTERFEELVRENEMLLLDVEEYRRNEDDYIKKITSLQKYVSSFNAAQKQVVQLTGEKEDLLAKNSDLEAQVAELRSQLSEERAAAADAAEVQRGEADKRERQLEEQLKETQSTHERALKELEAECAQEIKKYQAELQAFAATLTVPAYFQSVGYLVDEAVNSHSLIMKTMRSNVSFEGIPWPLNKNTSWDALGSPFHNVSKPPTAGFSGLLSAINIQASLKQEGLDVEGAPEGLNHVKRLLSLLVEADLNAAYFYVMLQKLAASNLPAAASGGVGGGGGASGLYSTSPMNTSRQSGPAGSGVASVKKLGMYVS